MKRKRCTAGLFIPHVDNSSRRARTEAMIMLPHTYPLVATNFSPTSGENRKGLISLFVEHHMSYTFRCNASCSLWVGEERGLLKSPGFILGMRNKLHMEFKSKTGEKQSFTCSSYSVFDPSRSRRWGNRMTSRMVFLPVRSMIKRSTPIPKPPLGGMP